MRKRCGDDAGGWDWWRVAYSPGIQRASRPISFLSIPQSPALPKKRLVPKKVLAVPSGTNSVPNGTATVPFGTVRLHNAGQARAVYNAGAKKLGRYQTRKEGSLIKDLWAFHDNRIAVRFQYEWHNAEGQWFRAYGNEQWEFDENGLMRRREASINDVEITESQRRFHWPAGPRPDDHPGLSDSPE